MLIACFFKGAIGLGNGLFRNDGEVPPAGKSLVNCTGSENRLTDCPSVKFPADRTCETASAVCQGDIHSYV